MNPGDILNKESKNKLNKIKKIEKVVDRENVIYRAIEHIFCFKNFKTIVAKTFGRDIYNVEITLREAYEDQSNLLL